MAAGLTEVSSLRELLRASSIVLAICPPAAARQVAEQVASLGFGGVYVDANAISSQSALGIGALIEEQGGDFVDGGIIGSPARPGGDTRLYLAGGSAATVAAIFQGSDRLTARVLEGSVGSASALKVCYAAWTKGSTALLLAVRAAAARLQVEDDLLEEWRLSQPELDGRFSGILKSTPGKAWRFVAEMEEIAEALELAGVPGGFHRAAADVYSRLTPFRGDSARPSLAELLEAVASPVASRAADEPEPLVS
jgi:3-hydroxyisobutyrate dehydrogenase-like beta-hydroxyacid dehydrogenase